MKIHIDIDCFFASALRTVEKSLLNKPMAVGGRSDTKIFDEGGKQVVDFKNKGSFTPVFYKAYEKKDDDIKSFLNKKGETTGVITTASYEAREYGVKTGMRIKEALALCPHLIIKAPNMPLFQELSHKLHIFLEKNIPIVEQASIDEFFGDLYGYIKDSEVEKFINDLRIKIKNCLDLPVSIGASKTKYIAKLATKFAKPFGCKVVYEHQILDFIKDIPVEDFPGIGRRTAKKLYGSGIYTLGEFVKRKDRVFTLDIYTKDLYYKVTGKKDEALKPNRSRKSIGISRTIEPIYDRNELKRRIIILSRHLSYAIIKLNLFPTSYHLSLKYEYHKKTFAKYHTTTLFSEKLLQSIALKLLKEADIYKQLHIIRISMHCSNFTHITKKELDLTTFYKAQKYYNLTKSEFVLQDKYGLDILYTASELNHNL